MPVNTKHKEYEASIDRWTRCRDCAGGSDVVKKKGRAYLPPLDTHKTLGTSGSIPSKLPSLYDYYVQRALFYNATGRTIEGLAGFVFQKPPVVEVDEQFADQFDDVTATGIDIATFALKTTTDILTTGRAGILIDMSPDEKQPEVEEEKPKALGPEQPKEMREQKAKAEGIGEQREKEKEEPAEEKAEKKPEEKKEDVGVRPSGTGTAQEEPPRPYWVAYKAEDIVSWRTERRGPDPSVLTRVVLCELVDEPDPKDEFVFRCVEQYRELRLNGDVYEQRIWRKKKDIAAAGGEAKATTGDAEEFAVWKTVKPHRRQEPLNRIPFTFLSPVSTSVDVVKPPLLDLVDVNLSHYRTMADLEHGRHFTALPTPWVAGSRAQDDNEPLTVGSGVAWDLEKGGQAGMLEFTGAGLGALSTAEADKRKMMAILGARLLEDQAQVAETATAILLRHSSEGATLRTLTETLSEALTAIAQRHIWWISAAAEPEDVDVLVKLNQEFFSIKMTSQDLAAQLQLLQAEAISYETFYYNITAGGWTRPEVDADDEKEQIEKEKAEAAPPPGEVPPGTVPGEVPESGLPPGAEPGLEVKPGEEEAAGPGLQAGDKVVQDEGPYKIVRRGGKYLVMKADTGEVVGTHPDMARAKRHVMALAANVKDAKPEKKGAKFGSEE